MKPYEAFFLLLAHLEVQAGQWKIWNNANIYNEGSSNELTEQCNTRTTTPRSWTMDFGTPFCFKCSFADQTNKGWREFETDLLWQDLMMKPDDAFWGPVRPCKVLSSRPHETLFHLFNWPKPIRRHPRPESLQEWVFICFPIVLECFWGSLAPPWPLDPTGLPWGPP